jgi:hypothetical protein
LDTTDDPKEVAEKLAHEPNKVSEKLEYDEAKESQNNSNTRIGFCISCEELRCADERLCAVPG